MKPNRSIESVRLRRDLAQLVRRLKAIRKEKLSQNDLASRINLALVEARSISQLVTFADIVTTHPHATVHTDTPDPRDAEQGRSESDNLLTHTDLTAEYA